MCNRTGRMKFSFLCTLLKILDKVYRVLREVEWSFSSLNSCVEQDDNIVPCLQVTICFYGTRQVIY